MSLCTAGPPLAAFKRIRQPRRECPKAQLVRCSLVQTRPRHATRQRITVCSASRRSRVCGAAEDAAVDALRNKVSRLEMELQVVQNEAVACMAEVRLIADSLEEMRRQTASAEPEASATEQHFTSAEGGAAAGLAIDEKAVEAEATAGDSASEPTDAAAEEAAAAAAAAVTDEAALREERAHAQEAMAAREQLRQQKRDDLAAALSRADAKAALASKIQDLIAAVEVELIGALADAAPPAPPPPPPPKGYETEEELKARFLELERGDLEGQLRRELRARGGD